MPKGEGEARCNFSGPAGPIYLSQSEYRAAQLCLQKLRLDLIFVQKSPVSRVWSLSR